MYVAGDQIEFIKENGTQEQQDKVLFAFIDFHGKISHVLGEILQQSAEKRKCGRAKKQKKSVHLRLVKS